MATQYSKVIRSTLLLVFSLGVMLIGLLPQVAGAAEEVASAIRRYKEREASSGIYEQYEVRPRRQRSLVAIPGLRQGTFPYSPAAAKVRIRARLADSHLGVKFYRYRRCEACHPEQTHDIHIVRANLTCRQCHGTEPIASIDHYYSPLNPIRRHAYVCSKCHQGATANYAAYLVHEPNPALLSTRKDYPVLFYAFWFMIAITVITFGVFIPHTILWGVRELFTIKKK